MNKESFKKQLISKKEHFTKRVVIIEISRLIINCAIMVFLIESIVSTGDSISNWLFSFSHSFRLSLWIIAFFIFGAINVALEIIESKSFNSRKLLLWSSYGIILLIVYIIIGHYFHDLKIQILSVAVSIVFIPIGAFCLGVTFQPYRIIVKTRLRQLLTPSDTIMTVGVISMIISAILLCCYIYTGNELYKSILISMITGIIVSA